MVEHIALIEAVYYILLSLYSPLHGYGIMQNVEKISGGRVVLAPGTLYGALSKLQERGWIEALPEVDGDRKKEYMITAAGKVILSQELARLEELVENGRAIILEEG